VREYREETDLDVLPAGKIAVLRSSYTRYRITMHGYFCRLANGADPRSDIRLNEAEAGRFVPPTDLRRFAFPSGHARLVAKLLADVRLQDFVSGRF
jgi:A/G-specific adenine glycosylase